MTPKQRLAHKLRDGKYRARLAGVPAEYVSADDVAYMLDQEACYYCLTIIGKMWSLEHKIPLAAEGTPGHVISNLAKSCTRCNELKHTETEEDFIEYIRATTGR